MRRTPESHVFWFGKFDTVSRPGGCARTSACLRLQQLLKAGTTRFDDTVWSDAHLIMPPVLRTFYRSC
jgi:hypothetical protein